MLVGMNSQRVHDRGAFRGTNLELLIFVAIVGILAAIALPNLLALMDKRNSRCLENLVAWTNGPLPPGTVCPKCGNSYGLATNLVGTKRETEILACPATEKHLETEPAFVRTKGELWRLEQTFPADTGQPMEFGQGSLDVKESPGRLALHVKPSAVTRYVLGPFFFLLLSVAAIACLVAVGTSILKGLWREGVFPLLGAVGLGALAWWNLTAIVGSHEVIFERSSSRVTRVEYAFGSKSSESVYADCLGVVPIPGTGARPASLYLITRSASDTRQAVVLDTIPAKRLDVARRLNQILSGR